MNPLVAIDGLLRDVQNQAICPDREISAYFNRGYSLRLAHPIRSRTINDDYRMAVTVTIDELHDAYKNTLASWRTWDWRRKTAELAVINGMADRATDLGDPDLADGLDTLGEVIAADVERSLAGR